MQFRNITRYTNPFGEPKYPKIPVNLEKDRMRQTFTQFWESLNTHVRSIIISGVGVIFAVIFLTIAKWVFPQVDFTPTEYLVTQAIMAVIANLVKEQTLTT